MKVYQLLEAPTVTKLLPVIDEKGVSKVARGLQKSTQTGEGFLNAFYENRLGALATKNQTWIERRQSFIRRHWRPGRRLWTPKGEPTRLHLALIAWAYSPDKKRLLEYIERRGLKNRTYSPFLG